jgi:hypothetical protein
MDCSALRARIERGEPLDAAAGAHAASCEACRAVVDDAGVAARRLLAARVPDDGSPTRSSLEATRQRLARERGPLGTLRAQPTWQRLSLLLASMSVALGLELVDGAPHPLVDVAPQGLLVAFAGALLLWPLSRTMPSFARGASLCVALLLPLVLALWTTARAQGAPLESSPWPCFALGVALAAPFVVLLSALDRRAALGVQQALLAGAIAGVASHALLHLHCPSDAVAHLLLGHAPIAFAAALGALSFAVVRRSSRRAG